MRMGRQWFLKMIMENTSLGLGGGKGFRNLQKKQLDIFSKFQIIIHLCLPVCQIERNKGYCISKHLETTRLPISVGKVVTSVCVIN